MDYMSISKHDFEKLRDQMVRNKKKGFFYNIFKVYVKISYIGSEWVMMNHTITDAKRVNEEH